MQPAIPFYKQSIITFLTVSLRQQQFPPEIRIQCPEGFHFRPGISAAQTIHPVHPQINRPRQFFPQKADEIQMFGYAYSTRTDLYPCFHKHLTAPGKFRHICHFRMKGGPKPQLFKSSVCGGITVQKPFPGKAQIGLNTHSLYPRHTADLRQAFPIPAIQHGLPIGNHHQSTHIPVLLLQCPYKRKPLPSVLFKLPLRHGMFGKRTIRTVVITAFQAAPV